MAARRDFAAFRMRETPITIEVVADRDQGLRLPSSAYGWRISGEDCIALNAYLFVSRQFRTQNRFTLLLELLFVSTQSWTQNRFTLLLELL
jgi:hypothetical protein